MRHSLSDATSVGQTPTRSDTASGGKTPGSAEINKEDAKPNESDPVEVEPPKILSVLASVLQRLVTRNEYCFRVRRYQGTSGAMKSTIFHGVRAPGISIAKYLERIFKYANCSPSCFVVAYIFIDRLIHHQPEFPLIYLNVHRLLVTSVMLAAKLLDDVHYNNAFYAKVGGISNEELNKLELEFLFRLDFRVQVTLHVFESYCTHLEREMLCTGGRLDRNLPIFGDSDESLNIFTDRNHRLEADAMEGSQLDAPRSP